MNPLIGAALVQGGASIAGGLFSEFSANRKEKESRDFAREMAQDAFEKQKALFDYQNAYNSPSALRARMEAAGFNPLSAIQPPSSSVPSVGMGSTPSPVQPSFGFGQSIAQAGSSILQSKLTEAQIKNLEASANKQNADAGKTTALLPYEITQYVKNSELSDMQIKQTMSAIELSNANLQLTLERKKMTEVQIDNIIAATKQIDENISYMNEQLNLLKQESYAKIKAMDYQNRLSVAQSVLAYQNAKHSSVVTEREAVALARDPEKLSAEIRQLDLANISVSQQNRFRLETWNADKMLKMLEILLSSEGVSKAVYENTPEFRSLQESAIKARTRSDNMDALRSFVQSVSEVFDMGMGIYDRTNDMKKDMLNFFSGKGFENNNSSNYPSVRPPYRLPERGRYNYQLRSR